MAQAITGLPQWLFDNTASLQVWEREQKELNGEGNAESLESLESLERLKRNLKLAIENELTGHQRRYLSMYFFEELTMDEIGERVGVNKSTVCRTIQRARKRLNKALKYSF